MHAPYFIVICDLSGSTTFFHVNHKRQDCRKNVIEHKMCVLIFSTTLCETTAVAQWLRCCATNRKVAGSIPDGVIEIFH